VSFTLKAASRLHISAAIGKVYCPLLVRLRKNTDLSLDTYCIAKRSTTMAITTLKVLASLLQLHGPGATVQSDHQGIDALLNDLREQSSTEGAVSDQPGVAPDQPVINQVYFRRGGFVRGPHAGGFRRAGYYPGAGAFRRGGYYPGAGAFRRGGFVRGY
jgi:hypothetical protein